MKVLCYKKQTNESTLLLFAFKHFTYCDIVSFLCSYQLPKSHLRQVHMEFHENAVQVCIIKLIEVFGKAPNHLSPTNIMN